MDDKAFYDLAKRVDSIEREKSSWKNKQFLIPNFIAFSALAFGVVQYFNVDPLQKRLNELETLQLEQALDKSNKADYDIEMALMTISRASSSASFEFGTIDYSQLELALDKIDKQIDYTKADKANVHESAAQGHRILGNIIKAELHYDKAIESVLANEIDEKQFVRLQNKILSLYSYKDYFREYKFLAELDKIRLYKKMLSPESFERLEGAIAYQSFYVALVNNKLEILETSMKEIDNRFPSAKDSIKNDLFKHRARYTFVEKDIRDKVKSWVQVRLGSNPIFGDRVKSSDKTVHEDDS